MKASETIKNLGMFGVFLLGFGIFLFSLIVLHAYFLGINEYSERFYSSCQGLDENTVIVKITNSGKGKILVAEVYVDGKEVCKLENIPPNSSDACISKVNNKRPLYKIIAEYEGKKKIIEAGICYIYESKKVNVVD